MARYRFLFSARWLGMALLGAILVVACIFLGDWQHGRYLERAATNERIAAADRDESPKSVTAVLSATAAPHEDVVWTLVRAEGVYDPQGQVLVRNRNVDSRVGYEVITPLVLEDGTALLVDRGWVPPSEAGATELPEVPDPPSGTVTVTGQVRTSEGKVGEANEVDGTVQARSINIDQIAATVDYPVMTAYITQDPTADGFAAIPVIEERSWQNFAYSYQWWLFAVMIPVGLAVIARREAKTLAAEAEPAKDETVAAAP